METDISYTKAEKSKTYVGATLGYLFDGYNLLLTTFLVVTLATYFGVTPKAIVFAITLALVGSVIGGIFFGWLADRIGRRTTLLVTIVLFGIATIITGTSRTLDEFYLLQFIAGIGVGGEWGVGFSMLNEAWGTKSRGLAGGFLQAMFPAGGLLGAVTAGVMLGAYGGDLGWRYSYYFVGILSLVLLAFRFFVPESKVWKAQVKAKLEGKNANELLMKSPLSEIFSKETLRWTIFGTLMVFGFMFFFYSGQVFYPTFFKTVGQVPDVSVTLIVTIGSVLGIIAEVVIGGSNDLLGRKKSGIIFGVISIIVVFPFLYTAMNPTIFSGIGSYPSFYTYGLLYFFQASYAALFGVWLGEHYPTRMRATGSNFCYMVGRGFGGGLAPIIVPILAVSVGGLGVSMSIGMIIGAVVMTIGALGLKETKGVKITEVDAASA
ncbi:hypothetical protein IX51_03600 [uncultured archaeon]|nr:hypothetical protein IX51_03600 [uncultured archaeon]HKJ96910.1 MFS transporter [Thermoplasmataceae archaeon]